MKQCTSVLPNYGCRCEKPLNHDGNHQAKFPKEEVITWCNALPDNWDLYNKGYKVDERKNDI